MSRRAAVLAIAVPVVIAVLAAGARADAPAPAPDPLPREVERWAAFVRDHPDGGALWKDVKESAAPLLLRTEQALRDGHRRLALLRLSYLQENLAAAAYLDQRTPEQLRDGAAFEAEWTRMGGVLQRERAPLAADAFAGVSPALVRALGETALPQVRIYYDASLDYGRSTTPDSGLYYLGAAQARRDFAAFTRTLAASVQARPPAVRPLASELDALEGEMLAAYRPPLSIDQHPVFIAASSTLKEARELDALGLRHGALLRYLQAALRFAALRAGPAPDDGAAAAGLRAIQDRLERAGVDHSIGLLFVEQAQADLAEQRAAGKPAVNASAIVSDVLPRYLAALQPAAPSAPRPDPQVTVTLVRWPYT